VEDNEWVAVSDAAPFFAWSSRVKEFAPFFAIERLEPPIAKKRPSALAEPKLKAADQ